MTTEAVFDRTRVAEFMNDFADAILLWYLIAVAEARPRADRRRERR